MSTAWGKMDGYYNSLMTSAHVLDAFRDNPIDLSLPALNSLEFDDNLSANYETGPISTLGSPVLNKKSTRHTAAGCRRRGSRAFKDRQREVLGKRDAGTPYFQ